MFYASGVVQFIYLFIFLIFNFYFVKKLNKQNRRWTQFSDASEPNQM